MVIGFDSPQGNNINRKWASPPPDFPQANRNEAEFGRFSLTANICPLVPA
jgi:hypothetical protein